MKVKLKLIKCFFDGRSQIVQDFLIWTELYERMRLEKEIPGRNGCDL